jgi:hypothetical protein
MPSIYMQRIRAVVDEGVHKVRTWVRRVGERVAAGRAAGILVVARRRHRAVWRAARAGKTATGRRAASTDRFEAPAAAWCVKADRRTRWRACVVSAQGWRIAAWHRAHRVVRESNELKVAKAAVGARHILRAIDAGWPNGSDVDLVGVGQSHAAAISSSERTPARCSRPMAVLYIYAARC